MASAGFAKLFTSTFVSDVYSTDFPDGQDVAQSQAENAVAAADAKGDGQAKVAALLLHANIALKRRDAAKVEEHLDEAGKLCRRLKFDEGKGYMLIMQAKLELWYGSADEAVSWSRDALKIFKKMGKDRMVAFASNMHAFVLSCAGKPQDGMRCARESLMIYQQVEDKVQEVSVLRLLMDMFINAGDTLRAGLVGWEIVKVVDESGGEKKHKVNLSEIISKVSDIEFQGNDMDKAMAAAENAQSRFQQAGDVHGEARTMKTMMNVFLRKQKFYEGIGVAKSIVDLYRSAGIGDSNLGNALMDLARTYLQGDCFDEAVESASQALVVFQQAQDGGGYGAASDMLRDLGEQQKKQNMKIILEMNKDRLGHIPTNLIIAPDGLNIDAINGFDKAVPKGKKR